MPVVRVEPEPQVKQSPCEQCGGTMWMILGFVYADDNPHGIYYVDWCEGPHDVRAAFITLSLGDYADDTATGADRSAFCVETRCEGMSLSERPVRDRPEFLGRFLPRDDALRRPEIEHVWHVCDHLTDDRRFAAVAAWLCGDLDTALDTKHDAPPMQ